jgi:hypothetical protein
MAIRSVNISGGNGFPVKFEIDTDADHSGLPNSVFFKQADKDFVVRYKDALGNIVDAFLSPGSGAGPTVVANYSALPAAAAAIGLFYWASSSQGTKWLPGSVGGTYYPNGLYYSNGTSWEYFESPYQATQSEVNTGTNTDKFVTPSTLSNSTQWATKLDANSSINALNDVTVSSPTNGQLLQYNFTTSQWENQSITIGTGDMQKTTYDTDNDGIVDYSETVPVLVRNNSSVDTLRRGTIVYLSGSTGYRPNAVKAQANAESTSSGTFGSIISDIAPNSDGLVCAMGTLHNLDTRSGAPFPFTADTLVDGDALWLDPNNAGYVTKTKPQAPNHIVFIGIVARTHPSLGRVVYRISNGFELDELHNVKIDSGTLANNDIIQYNSSTSLWENKQPITFLNPIETYRGISFNNNSTTVVSEGGITMSSSASTTAQSVASTNFATKQIRLRYSATVVSGGRYTGTRGSALLWYIHGGFRYVCDFNISDTAYSAGCQQFYGLASQTTDLAYGGVGGTLVSTLTNIIGVGSENGDTNLQVFHNDATGTATKVDLGVNFPANRTVGAISTTVYSIELYNEPSSTNVKYKVTNSETGAIANGTISTNLPLSSQGLNFFASRCMSVTSVTSTGQFDLMKLGVYSQL